MSGHGRGVLSHLFESDEAYVYRRTSALGDEQASLERRVGEQDLEIDRLFSECQALRGEVGKLRATLGAVTEALITAGALDEKKLGPALRTALEATPRPRAGVAGPSVATSAPEVLTCSACSVEVKPSNSFLRDGDRFCDACY